MVALRAVPVWLLRGAFVVGVLASAPALAENTNAQPDELFSVPALSLRLESPADSAEPAASVSNPPRLELAGPPSGGGAEERMDLASAGVATEFPGYGERSMLV
ncbi:MAG TPA: hypothetical protein PLH97_12405, partial [Verrucomicrobiota bacterium]|nr:hypothetical protein [Verrucomicrobiota bacterium]